MALELYNTTLYQDANLVGYWRFESNLNDSKGSNNLTGSGSPTYATGQFGNGVVFASASSQYASVADNTALSITGNLSFMFWIKMTQLPSTAVATMGVSSKYNGTGNQRSWNIYFDSDDKLYCTYTADGTNTNREAAHTNAEAVVAGDVGNWRMFTVTIAPATKSIIIYKGASSVATTTVESGSGATSIYDSTADFMISSTPAIGGYLDASVDDAALFNKVLTSTEISNHYNGLDGVATSGMLLFM